MSKTTKVQKSFQQLLTSYEKLRNLACISHANINIKGGNFFQEEVFDAIAASGKHEFVSHEHHLPLRTPEKNRQYHKVDILIVESDYVLAINSKGKSFNNTKSVDSELGEYQWYMSALEKEFSNKKVSYIIFKDEYDPSNSKMSAYHYLNKNGIPVYNTEEYMVSNYGVDFQALEQRRQARCVAEFERVFVESGGDLKILYEAIN
jgi:hypothetical protein